MITVLNLKIRYFDRICRQSLSRQISGRYLNPDGKLICIGFSPDVEDALTRGLQMGDGGTINLKLSPDIQQKSYWVFGVPMSNVVIWMRLFFALTLLEDH